MTIYSNGYRRFCRGFWFAEEWLHVRVSHRQLCFFMIGGAVAFVSLFLLRMSGLSTISTVVGTILSVLTMTAISWHMRGRVRTAPFEDGDAAMSFIGALFCVLSFLMGAIK